jgi:hypothetical protein
MRRTTCLGLAPSRWCETQSGSIPAHTVRPVAARVHREWELTLLCLTIPGASRVAPARTAGFGKPDATYCLGRKHTIHDADLRSDIVVIAVQLRDLEVLVVIGRVQEVRSLCGCMTLSVHGIISRFAPRVYTSAGTYSHLRPSFFDYVLSQWTGFAITHRPGKYFRPWSQPQVA